MEISVRDYARECAERGLRGDYSPCRADFTVEQAYDYSDDQQEVWRLLCDRQTKLTNRLAHRSYLDGVETLGLPTASRISMKSTRSSASSRGGRSWPCPA